MKMYEIPDALRDLHESAVDPDTGEIDEAYTDTIEALEMELESKVEYLALLSNEKKAEADVFKREADRLAARAKARSNEASRIKDFLLFVLNKAGASKVEGELATVAVQRNGRPSIAWAGSPDEIPEEFVEEIPAQRRLNSQEAYKAWKDSADDADDRKLPEGFVVELGSHVRVR